MVGVGGQYPSQMLLFTPQLRCFWHTVAGDPPSLKRFFTQLAEFSIAVVVGRVICGSLVSHSPIAVQLEGQTRSSQASSSTALFTQDLSVVWRQLMTLLAAVRLKSPSAVSCSDVFMLV